MLAEIGYLVIVVAFSTSIFGIVASAWGAGQKDDFWIEGARRSMIISFPLVSIALICLTALLITNNFQVQYVYNVSSRATPVYLKLAALWGGQAGSLLFWVWLLSGCAFLMGRKAWRSDRDLFPWVSLIILFTMAFYLSLVVFVESPFTRYWYMPGTMHVLSIFKPRGFEPMVPLDGNGLNPLLQHAGMIFHPPALYIGFIAFIVPFAYAVAALITNRLDIDWIRSTRVWTFVAWIFLSIGLILGARWAYDVLGWGGYWGWDPVEISALMPWLTGTAYIHSVMIQERRGMFKRWNVLLILITYMLIVFGTFITRSGVISSVHAFSESTIGPLYFGFIAITFFVTVGLIIYRWNDLKSEGYISSIFSREGLFLINNFLFITITIICFWGVIFPMISEAMIGQQAVVGPEFYEKATGPLFAALVFLMGVAPLSVWGYSSVKNMGKNAWKIMALTIVFLVVMFITGIRQWQPLLGFGVSIFAGLLTIVEYFKGIVLRIRRTGENFFTSMWRQSVRNRTRYGAYLIHLGVVFIGVAVIGIELFQTETQGTLSIGDSLSINGYSVTYQNMSNFDTDDGRNIAMAYLEVTDPRGHNFYLYPRRDYYYNSQQAVTIPGVRSNVVDDIYSVLVDWDPFETQTATFSIYRNPLVIWLWIGGIIFVLGALLAIKVPDKNVQDVD